MAQQMTSAPSRQEFSRLNKQWVEILETGDVDRIDEVIARDFVDHNPSPGTTPDRQGVIDWIRETHTAFSNVRVRTDDEIVDGDKIVVRAHVTGTHTGPFQGVPATNKSVDVETIDILRVKDGKAVEHWGVFDALGLLQQLGVVEAPATPEVATRR